MSSRRGYLYVVAAAVLWASSGVSSKFLFQSGVSPFQLVQLRISIAAGCLFTGLLIWKPKWLKIDRSDFLYFTILGAAMAAVQFTYLFAISKIHVAAAILLQYLAPSLIALYAVAVARQKLRASTAAALIGSTSGCYLVVGAYNLNLFELNMPGLLGGLGAAVSFAWYSIQGEYGMRRYPPWTVLFYAASFAAVAWNLLQPPFGAFTRAYSPVQWGFILYVALLGTLLPYGLYFEAIRRIRSTPASIAATLEPITAALISYLFLSESLNPPQILGAILVIASVALIQSRRADAHSGRAR